MSQDTVKETQDQQLTLYKSGLLSQAVNSALATNGFTAVASIDVSKLDSSKLEVFVYGHNINSTNDFATIPNQGTLALIGSNVLLAAWKLVGTTLQIGFVNPNPGFTPAAPFTTVYLSYFVFIH